MRKLFGWASWIGFASFVGKISDRISRHPRLVRSLIKALLNLVAFFCFFIVIYGLGLKLEPALDHPDHSLMSFGIKFVSTAAALLLSVGLYFFIRSLVVAAKFVADKVSGVNRGFKDSGTVVIKIPKKTVETVKQGVEATTQWAGRTGAEIKKVTVAGTKKCKETLQAKTPQWSGAIRTTTQKTASGVMGALHKTACWTKDKIPQTAKKIRGIAASAVKRIKTMRFKKKATPDETERGYVSTTDENG